MTCRICAERPIPPGMLRQHLYSCSRCWYYRHQERRRKYRQSAKGRATRHRQDARRVKIGRRMLGFAKTIAEAQQINAHIRRRLAAFRRDAGVQCDRSPA